MQMKEIEVKILNVNPSRIRKILRKNKAKFVKKVFQKNILFENEHTKKNGNVVRIRIENKDSWITIKSAPVIIKGHKIRHEHETKIKNPLFWQEAFKMMGFRLLGITECIREYYNLGGCSVEILKIPGIPEFLEIEGSQENIKKAVNLLGYDTKDYSAKSVLEIYGKKSKFLTFKKSGGKLK